MQFSDDSSIILKHLLPQFTNIRNTNKISKISNVIDIIYDDLIKGNNYYTKISDNINIK